MDKEHHSSFRKREYKTGAEMTIFQIFTKFKKRIGFKRPDTWVVILVSFAVFSHQSYDLWLEYRWGVQSMITYGQGIDESGNLIPADHMPVQLPAVSIVPADGWMDVIPKKYKNNLTGKEENNWESYKH